MQVQMKKVKRIILLTAGVLALSAGIIGIFLPVLPTTPFLLLSSWCFLNSSEKLYRWLMTHPVLGYPIFLYQKKRAVPRKTKISALVLLWLGIGISLFLIENRRIESLLFIILAGVTIHLLRLKTLNEPHNESFAEEYRDFTRQLST
jgi:hypothetical protein